MQIETNVRCWQIVLQKSFCGMGLKFSEAWARRLNNDVGDHVATRQTHRRVWQRVCGSIERRLSLVSFFGENLAAAAFGTFATLSAQHRTFGTDHKEHDDQLVNYRALADGQCDILLATSHVSDRRAGRVGRLLAVDVEAVT